MAEFDNWAKYYDVIHRGLPGEAEFYVGQAVRRGGSVLELGCGTGRLAIPMAMSGVHVVGLDNSKPMLDECRAKLRAVGSVAGAVHLVQADMAAFGLNQTFDLAVMAYRTFMHLLTPDRQRQCLIAIRGRLSGKGLLILNVWAPKPSLIAPCLNETRGEPVLVGRYSAPGGSRTLLHYCASAYDEFLQLITEKHVLHEVDKKGGIRSKIELSLVRAWTTPREMDNLVRLCGFDVVAVFGDFDCSPFSENSTETIWALRPAGN